MSKKEAQLKATMDLPRAIAYLEDLAKSLKAGKVCVTNCDKTVTLNPEKLVKLDLEAVQKDDRESLSLEISWRKHRETVADDGEVRLTISAVEPKPSTEESFKQTHRDSKSHHARHPE